MYGYIRIHAPELKVREQEYYRAVYCGLCRTMGICTGQCSRMTLSYDFTFFALVRMALTENLPTVKGRRCIAHPTRRRPMAEPDDTLRFCAGLSAILAYHKVRDDLRDERGLKRTSATLLRPYMAHIRRRALKRALSGVDMNRADRDVMAALDALCELESSRVSSVDRPADAFGGLLAAILSQGLTDEAALLARTIGRHVGRWVYILDAADDFEEDARKGRYNPLLCLYGDKNPDGTPMTTLPESKREQLHTALLGELISLERAFDLLNTHDPDLRGILSNILYEGMPRAAGRVLFGEGTQDSPSSNVKG